MQNSQYRVLADYEVHDPHPLSLAQGSEARIAKQDTGWPGWFWVESGQQAGWIPASFLESTEGSVRSVVKNFDGTDLSARCGETLSAIEDAPGWIYAENPAGQRGWFPLFNLKPLPRI